jgi:hypothetical protein
LGIPSNVELIRDYGWRAGCPATGMTGVGVGSVDWFGIFRFISRSSYKIATTNKIIPTNETFQIIERKKG